MMLGDETWLAVGVDFTFIAQDVRHTINTSTCKGQVIFKCDILCQIFELFYECVWEHPFVDMTSINRLVPVKTTACSFKMSIR